MAAPKRLNRDALISTALEVADREGLDAVTIRRVAQRHDVTPMALYRHFPDKDGIFDAVIERLLAQVRLPEHDERPWDEQMTELLSGLVEALRPHPNAATLVFSRILSSTPGRDITERTLALLRRSGMPVEQAAETASQTLSSLVALVIAAPGRTGGPEIDEAAAAREQKAALLALPEDRYPHLVAAADAMSSCGSEALYYGRGVDLIVTGMRGAQRPEAVTGR
ncbi:TetR/AcrR family transcriptional regulator [Streptomyces sp. NPDC051976]|uniref:TetR/AcrR family transcriptional regulator n=1 Tax=Streptomyces sp. NPDC051976 TaxID=3154947 RepID=UPI003427B2A9